MTMASDPSYICPIVVGRATQLHALDRAIQQVRDGGSSALLLSGEAGIGKSRLVAEAASRATAERFRVLRGECFENGRSLPYSAVVEVLRSCLFGRTVEEQRDDLGEEARELARLLPEIAPLTSNEPATLSPSDSEQEKRRLFHSLLRFINRLSDRQPVLVVVEDLHWSDETTLDFLHFLCRHLVGPSPGCRVLLLMTYRSDEIQPSLAHFLAEMDRTRSAVELPLDRLTAAETDVMLRAILDLRQPARRDFLDALHNVTDGNPFFIEEVLKSSSTRDAGQPAADAAGFRLEMNRVPRTVEDALRQRMTMLGPPARHLLDVAAVAGMRLDIELLQAVAPENAGSLLADLKELVAAQLIVEDGASFSFRHALSRQAVYSQLLAIERRELHRRIGEAVRKMYEGSARQLEMHVDELAHHFYEAGAWEDAALYCRLAGERAAALSAHGAVIEYLERAREAARQVSQAPSPRLLRLLANAYEVVGEFEHAQATMQAALEASQQEGDQREQVQTLIGLGAIWSARDYAKTGEYWRSGLEVARAVGDEALLARSLNRVGNWYLNIEQPAEAIAHHEEALRVFERIGDIAGLAETVDLLGMAWFLGGDMAKSRSYYERALSLFEQLQDRQGYISSLSTLAVCAPVYHNDTLLPAVTSAKGSAWLEEARAMAAEMGWRSGEAYALFDLGLVFGPAGDYGRALECALDGLAIADEINHLAWISAALCTLGSIQMDLLDLQGARGTLERAHRTAKDTGSLHWTRVSAGFLARCCLGIGETEQARSVLDGTLDAQTEFRTLGQRVLATARIELALAQKKPDEAIALVESMLGATGNAGPVPPRLGWLRADALALLGDSSRAETAYQDALTLAEAQGQLGLLWRIHAALARLYRETGRRSRSLEERRHAGELIDRLAETVTIPATREAFLSAAAAYLPSSMTQLQAAKITFGGLTEREREIATLLARGLTNAELAQSLVISERTVETHITNVLAKLNFSSRSQIAIWAVETGLSTRE